MMQQISDEVRCLVCNRIFCCADCRIKHEIVNHSITIRRRHSVPVIHLNPSNIQAILDGEENPPELLPSSSSVVTEEIVDETLYLICPICKKKPLVLKAEMFEELLVHIEYQHLPLRCRKCNKLYTKISDLKEFTKCLNNADDCSVSQETSTHSDKANDTDNSSKDTVTIPSTVAHSTMSTQTSPMPPSGQTDKDYTESDNLTPISIINMRWKAKSKITHEEFISDSVSSIRNLSSISNSSLRRSIGQSVSIAKNKNGKPIRTTSTPLHVDMIFAKSKEPTFNASGGYMSSINHSESEHSLPTAQANNNGCTPAQTVDNNLHRYGRVGGGRSKITPITPLRQVMSKSIQRAFVEHGGIPRNAFMHHRRNMYEPTEPIAHELNNNVPLLSNADVVAVGSDVGAASGAPTSPGGALDLRLSPALRRTQSEGDSYCLKRLSSVGSKRPSIVKRQQMLMLSSQRLTTTESIIITRTQHVAGSVTSAENKLIKAYSVDDDCSSYYVAGVDSAVAASSSASLSTTSYKSCESVEIITASSAELGKANVPITPITRIPGAVINKKLIKFETPIKERSMEEMEMEANLLKEKKVLKSPDDDIFYTPPTVSPRRKIKIDKQFEDNSFNEKKKKSVVRQLSRRFSPPKARPPLREYSNSKAPDFSSVEDITNDFDDAENIKSDKKSPQQENHKHKHEQQKPSQPKPQQGAGRLWSLVSSVMRLPKLSLAADVGQTSKTAASNSKSIIKRCASIAGSLVRPKPMYDDEDDDDYDKQIQTLKRKRTYTMDDQITSSTSTSTLTATATSSRSREFNWAYASSPPTKLSKRLKIQCRKPIERMRWNNK